MGAVVREVRRVISYYARSIPRAVVDYVSRDPVARAAALNARSVAAPARAQTTPSKHPMSSSIPATRAYCGVLQLWLMANAANSRLWSGLSAPSRAIFQMADALP